MKYLIAIAFLACSTTAIAADCSKAESRTDEIQCLNDDGDVLIKKLQASYVRALKNAVDNQDADSEAPNVKATIEKAQALWWKYRDAECDARGAPWWQGQGYGPQAIYLRCMNELTRARIKELDSNHTE